MNVKLKYIKKRKIPKQQLLWLFAICLTIPTFQNCTEGFLAIQPLQSNLDVEGPTENPLALLSLESLQNCKAETSEDQSIIECLNNKKVSTENLTEEKVTLCQDNVAANNSINENLFDLALCLHKQDVPVYGYRYLKQSDIDKCSTEVSTDKIAQCLILTNGLLPFELTQQHIDTCASGDGIENAEKCLRANGLLPKDSLLFQEQVKLCQKISGQNNLASCLHSTELLSSNVLQMTLDICISNFGIENTVKCLKENDFAPNSIHQAHITYCSLAFGNDGIFSCLETNFANLPLTLNQAEIQLCINDSTLPLTAKCLREKNIISNLLENDDLQICSKLTGEEKLAECISNNGFNTQDLQQLMIDQCIVDVGIENLHSCLRQKALITSKFSELISPTGAIGMNCIACHNNVLASGGLNFNDFQTVSLRVDNIIPSNSPLLLRMQDAVAPMPPSGLLQNLDEVKQVILWLEGGANEN